MSRKTKKADNYSKLKETTETKQLNKIIEGNRGAKDYSKPMEFCNQGPNKRITILIKTLSQ